MELNMGTNDEQATDLPPEEDAQAPSETQAETVWDAIAGLASVADQESEGELSAEAEEATKVKAEDEFEAEEKPKAPEPTPRYRLVDRDGEEVEVEWDDGVAVTFKADGREVSVSNLDELVEMAQKGAHYSRRMRELKAQEQSLAADREAYVQALQQAEALLERVLTDKETFRRMRQIARRLKSDPDYAEALSAKQKLAQVEKSEIERTEKEREQYAQRFWESVRNEFTAHLPSYPHLVEDDGDEVLAQFYEDYQEHRAEVLEKVVPLLSSRGMPAESAEEMAELEALAYLRDPENLARAMQKLDAKYAKRLAPRQAKLGEKLAREHNARVEERLARKSPRTLRSAGSAPAPSSGALERPSTFRGYLDAISREIERALG